MRCPCCGSKLAEHEEPLFGGICGECATEEPETDEPAVEPEDWESVN